ncbi:MAG: hypothetical protein FWG63_10050 [Defluviitaleaceae bacterium]|nr:hypothetical protein [Defluviitaleaceae bacterium]
MEHKDINLLPKIYKERKKTKLLAIILTTVQFFVAIILISAWQFTGYIAYTQSNQLQNMPYLSYHLVEANHTANEVAQLRQDISQKYDLIAVMGQNIGNEYHIDTILENLPPTLRLQYISYNNDGRIFVNILATNINYVPIFTSNLIHTGYFRGVQIVNATNIEGGIIFGIEMFLVN